MNHKIYFLIFPLMFLCCEPKTDIQIQTTDCTDSTRCTLTLKLIEGEPKIDSVKVREGTRLLFRKENQISKAIFIFPKADNLFNNNQLNRGDTIRIGNILFLMFTLGDEDTSNELSINEEANLTKQEKRYPYSVYVPGISEMAEGNSSPVIIVD